MVYLRRNTYIFSDIEVVLSFYLEGDWRCGDKNFRVVLVLEPLREHFQMEEAEKAEPIAEAEGRTGLGFDGHTVVVQAHLLDGALQFVLKEVIYVFC